jgi:hypothetical protein
LIAYPPINRDEPMHHALHVVQAVCRLAGPSRFVDAGRAYLARRGIITAVHRHNTAVLFDWLMEMLSFQGIADRVANQFLQTHGNVAWDDIDAALKRRPHCRKLGGFWLFDDCRYEKGAGTCAEPGLLAGCPLPKHVLRNGRLNQTAYSLFLFMRDVAAGDFVQWIDRQIADCTAVADHDRLPAMRAVLVDPLRGVYGISDKVTTMALSSLLLGAGRRRPYWIEVGASFVVVDTLVHNFLHRTGILARFAADHAYGPACYRANGCAHLIDQIAQHIDARAFNPTFPAVFPRFVQLAIWRYCSESGRDICNGNRIDDRHRCDNIYCQVRSRCDRVTLHKTQQNRVFYAS